MANNELTEKQRRTFEVVDKYKKEKEIAPTRQELKELLNEKSVHGVNQKLRQLEKKGYIKIGPPGRKRNIVILRQLYRQMGLFDE
jgi:SOS-response transcriptional repressor LexA